MVFGGIRSGTTTYRRSSCQLETKPPDPNNQMLCFKVKPGDAGMRAKDYYQLLCDAAARTGDDVIARPQRFGSGDTMTVCTLERRLVRVRCRRNAGHGPDCRESVAGATATRFGTARGSHEPVQEFSGGYKAKRNGKGPERMPRNGKETQSKEARSQKTKPEPRKRTGIQPLEGTDYGDGVVLGKVEGYKNVKMRIPSNGLFEGNSQEGRYEEVLRHRWKKRAKSLSQISRGC